MIYVLTSPSGGGKTTLLRQLVNEKETIIANVSYTTRKMRAGEKEGKDYFFVSKDEFLKKKAEGEIFESVDILATYMGLLRHF